MSSVTPSSIALLNQLSKSSLIELIQNIQSNAPTTTPIIDSFIASSLKSSSSSSSNDYILPYSPSSIYPSSFLSSYIAPGRALNASEESKSLLFSPKKIRSIEFKNRIIVSPMCMYSCAPTGPYAGHANDFHLVHIGRYALGGAGGVMMEASAVHPAGRISPNDLGIWSDSMIPALKKITNFLHTQQCMAGIQLAHAGRKATTNCAWLQSIKGNVAKGNHSLVINETGEVDMGKDCNPESEVGWETNVVGPSSIKWDDNNNWPLPHSLSIDEIKFVISLFKNAARRALSAGFDFIEIHGAHGYLLSSFLSPVSNKRTDEYGGSFENRIRLLEEVVKGVREVWPEDKPLFVRVSSTEYADELGGWNINDTVKLAPRLAALGVDLFDASSGGNYSKQSIPFFSSYQLPFAEAVKKTNTPHLSVGTVGMLTEAKQCETILQNNQADFIFIAREFLRTPQWPLEAAKQLDVQIGWPQQFDRAKTAVKK